VVVAARRALMAAKSGMVKIGDFYVDIYEYPNRAGSQPLARVDYSVAANLCAEAGKRLTPPSRTAGKKPEEGIGPGSHRW
jgi:hypothetical protein